MTGLPITCPKLWFSSTTRKTWSAAAEGGGGLVITFETPPQPAQISAVAKKKNVKTGFMWALRTYTRMCLFSGLDASALSYVAPKTSRNRVFRAKYGSFYAPLAFDDRMFAACSGRRRRSFQPGAHPGDRLAEISRRRSGARHWPDRQCAGHLHRFAKCSQPSGQQRRVLLRPVPVQARDWGKRRGSRFSGKGRGKVSAGRV